MYTFRIEQVNAADNQGYNSDKDHVLKQGIYYNFIPFYIAAINPGIPREQHGDKNKDCGKLQYIPEKQP